MVTVLEMVSMQLTRIYGDYRKDDDMNRRTAIKAMLGSLTVVGCRKGTPGERLVLAEKMELMNCIRLVEIGYDNNFSNISGNNGELGPMQITEQYVDDINRIANFSGERFKYADRQEMDYCRTMSLVYWDHYATTERLGHEPTIQDLARIHNGGPNGWKRASTLDYWRKVKVELDKENK